MPDIALRPRSATEIVDAAFQVYRREPLQFIVALGLIYVPWLAVTAALNIDPAQPSAGTGFAPLILAPIALIVYALASGVTISLANDVYFGRKADIASAFRRSARKLWPLIATALAVAAMIGVAVLVVVLATSLLGPVLRIAIGALFFIAMAIFVGIRFFAARACVVIEDFGTDAALRRSWRLTRGQAAHAAGTLLLAIVIVMVVLVGETALAQIIPSRIAQAALSALASVLVVPLFSITETLLYFDMRIRNEGFDLEYLAASLPVPEPEQAGS